MELPPGSGCLGLVFRRDSDGLTLPFRCDGWGCPTCGPTKGRRVARAVRLAAVAHGFDHLVTLTLPGCRKATLRSGTEISPSPARGDPVASRVVVAEKWNALRTFLRKKGVLEDYLAVPEFQQDGTAHVHLATTRRLDWSLLSEAWARLGGGFVFCSPTRTMRNAEDVARELAKYLTKTVDHQDGKQGAGFTTWSCKQEGGFRRRPWHRYWPSRAVGRTIRSHLTATAPEDAVDPPRGESWSLVVPIEGEDTRDYPPFRIRTDPVVPSCPGHLTASTECCHGEIGLYRCECGGPSANPFLRRQVDGVLTDQTLRSSASTPPPIHPGRRPAGVGDLSPAVRGEDAEEGRAATRRAPSRGPEPFPLEAEDVENENAEDRRRHAETAPEGSGAPGFAGAGEDPPKNRRETASPSIPEEGPSLPAGGGITYRGRCWTCGFRVFASDPWTVADLMAAHVEEVHPT